MVDIKKNNIGEPEIEMKLSSSNDNNNNKKNILGPLTRLLMWQVFLGILDDWLWKLGGFYFISDDKNEKYESKIKKNKKNENSFQYSKQ